MISSRTHYATDSAPLTPMRKVPVHTSVRQMRRPSTFLKDEDDDPILSMVVIACNSAENDQQDHLAMPQLIVTLIDIGEPPIKTVSCHQCSVCDAAIEKLDSDLSFCCNSSTGSTQTTSPITMTEATLQQVASEAAALDADFSRMPPRRTSSQSRERNLALNDLEFATLLAMAARSEYGPLKRRSPRRRRQRNRALANNDFQMSVLAHLG